MDEREERAERASKLIPWATPGWSGYSRAVRDTLDDARRQEGYGNGAGAEYWLVEAERYAAKACNWDATVFQSDHTYREAWEQHKASRVYHPFRWPDPAERPEQ